MANNIAYAVKYLQMLDRIYKANAVTADLEAGDGTFKLSPTNEKTIYLRKMALDGLSDYSRASGYDSGDVDISWEAHTFAIDRGKKFNLDTMDAMEAYTTVAEVGAEFERQHVVPELDAYRFKKIVALCSVDVAEDLDEDTVVEAIDNAVKTMNDNEVPSENRVLYVSSTVKKLMKTSGEFFRTIQVQSNTGIINREISKFDDMEIKEVPKARFYTSVDLAASGAGGFSPTAGAKEINFMIAYKPAIIAKVKHVAPKIIMPEFNSDADGYLYCYRAYHDLFIADNKVNGIYIHSKA